MYLYAINLKLMNTFLHIYADDIYLYFLLSLTL